MVGTDFHWSSPHAACLAMLLSSPNTAADAAAKDEAATTNAGSNSSPNATSASATARVVDRRCRFDYLHL
ncbi:hypothetical protein PanWU01x14_352110 [Parasponia andersonii]|uniref:Uncharacterized protein n=1 Tax=Parasponia andersonii TaxID=3476 RepID=A0A2P5AAF4_PARAD|nr:hypothetical protein PanWU01x14_352110 [Parasponia andersonii]